MAVASLGYIRISVQDVGAWRSFGADILGLMVNEAKSDENTVYFRMDEHPSRLVIEAGAEDKLTAAGSSGRRLNPSAFPCFLPGRCSIR